MKLQVVEMAKDQYSEFASLMNGTFYLKDDLTNTKVQLFLHFWVSMSTICKVKLSWAPSGTINYFLQLFYFLSLFCLFFCPSSKRILCPILAPHTTGASPCFRDLKQIMCIVGCYPITLVLCQICEFCHNTHCC